VQNRNNSRNKTDTRQTTIQLLNTWWCVTTAKFRISLNVKLFLFWARPSVHKRIEKKSWSN
jgi:hypothetical protein